MSPLTPYSPGLPILWPGGGVGAREVGKGPLMSTAKSSRASSGLVVSIVIFLLPPPLMARLTLLLECYVYESGALVLSVWLLGVMGKLPYLVVTVELLSTPKACHCDTGLDRLVCFSSVLQV